MKNAPIDKRGYRGSERNRALDPGDVIWARQAYLNQTVTARELAMRFSMSLDGVRRMLRGDTYTNVGEALPRAQDVEELRKPLNDGGTLERLIAEAKGDPVKAPPPAEFATPFFDPPMPTKPGEPTTGDEAVEQFLRESATTKEPT